MYKRGVRILFIFSWLAFFGIQLSSHSVEATTAETSNAGVAESSDQMRNIARASQELDDDMFRSVYAEACYKYFFGNVRPVGKSLNDGRYYFSFDTNSLSYLIDPAQDGFDDIIRIIRQAEKEERFLYAKIDRCENKLITLSFTPDAERTYKRR